MQHLVLLPWKSQVCSWISPWSIKISWPRIHPWILLSSNFSQVHKKSCNKSSYNIIHYRVNKFFKSTCLAHLSLLAFTVIHYNIFWVSFALNIIFFLSSFTTCSSTCALPFFFIMALVLDRKHWRITIQTSYSKRSWRDSSPMFLLSCCCNSTSYSTGSDLGTWGVFSLAISWKIISTFSYESEIIIIHSFAIVIEVVIFLRNFRTTSNSSSNSLLFLFFLKDSNFLFCRFMWS